MTNTDSWIFNVSEQGLIRVFPENEEENIIYFKCNYKVLICFLKYHKSPLNSKIGQNFEKIKIKLTVKISSKGRGFQKDT
jgi:hypothetical protein